MNLCYLSNSDIKLDAVDKIYQYIYKQDWLKSEERAIDIQIVKKSTYIWIGYYHPEVPTSDNQLLAKLYKDIFNLKEKKEKRIIMIEESDVEDLSDEQLRNKANEIVRQLNSKIEELDTIVNKLIG